MKGSPYIFNAPRKFSLVAIHRVFSVILKVSLGLLACTVMACGSDKPTVESPEPSQTSEMLGDETSEAGAGGAGLPPLDEVEPAEEDVEVPPAP